MRRAVVLSLMLFLGGCGLLAGPRAAPTPASRGREVAQAACAQCHAVAPGGTSARPRAPGFASPAMQHTAGLDGRVAALAQAGHAAMPPIRLTPGQVADVVAYIESLSAPSPETRRRWRP